VGRAVISELIANARIEKVLAIQRPGESPLRFEKANGRVTPLHVDLTRTRAVRSLLFGPARHERCDVVLHLAAHRAGRDEGDLVHALNVESTRQLLELSERHPTIRRFVLRSYAEVYRVRPHHATILLEDHPLELSPDAPQWTRDRVEADVTACIQLGLSRLQIAVLRCAECPAPENGSQLWDYLESRVCFTPLGYDPVINLISISDISNALARSVLSEKIGIFNVPGADTFPLSVAIERARRIRIPVPGPLVWRLYDWRAATRGGDFRYDQNHFRFRFSGIMDGTRAAQQLGYVPRTSVSW
jgi:UDP-glucose 4-epimerase